MHMSLAIALLAFGLYANTLTHGFALDDAIVITENMYTQQGFSGIGGILSKDTFFGFFKEEGKANLVSGGRYRPLSLVMFAVEYAIAGSNPFVFHLISVLLYAGLCVLIYRTLRYMLEAEGALAAALAAAAALLYTAHPLHTEVVANIKGRDEILSMLGSIGALYLSLIAAREKKPLYFLLAGISLFLGLMAKENAITFVAVIPLAVWMFSPETLRKGAALRSLFPLLGASVLFLVIRGAVIGWQFGDAPAELMNNPYLKLAGNKWLPFSLAEKWATILYTLGRYVALMIFPHPLTHDYYPRHVDMMSWGDIPVLLSGLVYAAMAGFIVWGRKKHPLPVWGLLFFLLTLSIVSNIVFPIGTHMGERFMFMPSLGLCVAGAWLLSRIPARLSVGMLSVILLLFALKTVSRNPAWKDNEALFTTDIQVSQRSAKLNNALAATLYDKAVLSEAKAQRNTLLLQAQGHVRTAVELHPTYKLAWFLLGNISYQLGQYDNAVQAYEQTLALDARYKPATQNLAIALREGGRDAGEKRGDLAKATAMLERALSLNPNDAETLRLMGTASGVQGKHKDALSYFSRALQADPQNPAIMYDLGAAYAFSGNAAKADSLQKAALAIDPNLMENRRKGQNP